MSDGVSARLLLSALALVVSMAAFACDEPGENGADSGAPGDAQVDAAPRDAGQTSCVQCGGTCRAPTSFLTDRFNCGSCGNECGTGGTCSAGWCVSGSETCSYCNGTCRTGSSYSTDASNCGGCGVSCGTGGTCSGGACYTMGSTPCFRFGLYCITTAACSADSACRDGGYATWSLPSTPAHLPDYVVSAQTVVDQVTGLEWARTTSTTVWSGANAYCSTLTAGGKTGWRVPSRMELLSIVSYASFNPAIDLSVFPSTGSVFFWSSSPYADQQRYWGVDFRDGSPTISNPAISARVRCVRTSTP